LNIGYFKFFKKKNKLIQGKWKTEKKSLKPKPYHKGTKRTKRKHKFIKNVNLSGLSVLVVRFYGFNLFCALVVNLLVFL